MELSDVKNLVACAGGLTEKALLEAIAFLLSKIEENTDTLELKVDSINLNTDTLEAKLTSILDVVNNGLQIPTYDYVSWTKYGSTNNLHVGTFKSGGSGGSTVATITLTYFGSGAADDDTLQTMTLS